MWGFLHGGLQTHLDVALLVPEGPRGARSCAVVELLLSVFCCFTGLFMGTKASILSPSQLHRIV